MSAQEMDIFNKHAIEPRSNPTRQKSSNVQLKDQDGKFRKCMRINKPMIPLKIALFIWYGGGAITLPFFNLYLLQLGLSVSQLSFILTFNPVLQFIGPAIAGMVADKIGKSKPVLVANFILLAIVINSALLIPVIRKRSCLLTDVAEIRCSPKLSVKSQLNGTLECFVQCNSSELLYHTFPSYKTNVEEDPSSNIITKKVPNPLKGTFSAAGVEITSKNATWIDSSNFCQSILNEDCASFCDENGGQNTSWIKMSCPQIEDNSILVVTFCTIVSCLFTSLFSNTYRFMDVTSMFMVETYNSDFGRERFWSMLGITLMSPFASYLIDKTSPDGEPKDYTAAIYFVDGVLVFLMVALYKLDVRIFPPGRDMMKNAMKLVKNPDIVTFGLSLLVLGTSSNFNKIYSFIYLDQLGAPSIIMGLMLGMNSLCGLPFLLTSNWWIRKIGSSNLLLCGFLGHVFICLGYSFLENVWYALIYETSAIFTYHLLWVAVIRYSHEVAPEGLPATVIACAGGIHWALGRGVCSLVGGQVMSKYGGRWAYRLIAIICGLSGIAYGVFLQFRENRISRKLKATENLEYKEADTTDSII